jgi:streptogramin lyase
VKKRVVGILSLMLLVSWICWGQSVEVVGTVTSEGNKIDGVAWDGSNIWVTIYQSSPMEWRLAQLDDNGEILTSFVVPVTSLDDIHNFGMSNIASDGKTIWANHWNEGQIYRFTKKGKVKTQFGVPSVNKLIPVGLTLQDNYIWVLHWSDKKLYKLDKKGREYESISLRKLAPPPDMGLAWDGNHFWAANKGTNRVMKLTKEGEMVGMFKGPKTGGGIRDLAWTGELMLLVYQQDNTIYKLKISE